MKRSKLLIGFAAVVAWIGFLGAAPAGACTNNRYLPADTTWHGGVGPTTVYSGGLVGCNNSKRIYTAFGLAVAEDYNYGQHASLPYTCDYMSVRVYNNSFQVSGWYSANAPGLATATLSGSVLGSDYHMTNTFYGSAQWSVSWTYSGSCWAD